MISTMIAVLIGIVVLALLAFGMIWICNKFFPEFPPARWICGVILLIVLLLVVAAVVPNLGGPVAFSWHNR